MREVSPEEKLSEQHICVCNCRFGGIGYFAVFGAALSPDISITPVFLAAVPIGLVFASYLFFVFVVASILCQVLLVQVGIRGLAKIFEHVPEKYNDAIVGFVISLIGLYIIITA